MISCEDLFEIFKKNELLFFTGVPDSTFKEWMEFLDEEHGKRLTNIIACNECEATAIAAGYYLVTGKNGVVYMQNSGLGKVVNPVTSLLDEKVYSIPAIFVIGWRGEPDKKDEPQHKKMGEVMLPLLDCLKIPYRILPDSIQEAEQTTTQIRKLTEKTHHPVALVVRRGTLEGYTARKTTEPRYEMSREDAINTIIDNLQGNEAVISTTGKTSRELHEYRGARGEATRDFYMVGSMGSALGIAFGAALQTNKPVFVFDGDGAVLMQLGSLATVGHYKPKNLYHIIFDNSSYDSTGGQPTVSPTVDFGKISTSCGYAGATYIETKEYLADTIKKITNSEGPQMLVVKVNKGARKDLGRPTTTPIENKNAFMDFLGN